MEELEILLDKLRYLSRGASTVVFAGSLPRGVDEGFYADAVREMTRLGARVVLDAEGEPLRRGIEAEPWLVSPNQHEAEQLVGQELDDDDDFLMALDRIAEMGARNVHITMETGCFVLVREERQVRRYRAEAPQLDPVSILGAGDVLLARWLAALAEAAPGGGGAPARGRGRLGVGARGRRRPLRPEGGRAPRVARRGRRAAARRVESRARRAVSGRSAPSTRLVESTDSWSSSSIATASSARKAWPSTTCCSFRPSRPCSRTTSPPPRG